MNLGRACRVLIFMEPAALRSILTMIGQQEADDPAGAEAALRRLVDKHPGESAILIRLARLLHRVGRVDEAVSLMRQASQIAPTPATLNDLGSLYLAAGNSAEAVEAYQTAIRLDPRYVLARINLADTLAEIGRAREAIEAYRTALSIDPGSSDGHIGLAVALLRIGESAAAVAESRAALEVDPNNVQAWHVLAIGLGKSGDRQGAIAAEREALARNAGFAKGWHALGNFLDEAGEIEQAASAYRRALDLDPSLVEASYDLAALSAAPPPPQMPAGYVTRLFDDFAATFERRLVGELAYGVPEALRAAVARHWPSPPADLDVLDLGCGTGLVGKQFREIARRLTGVDLSPGMLAEAERSGVYDRLICDDVVHYLWTAEEQYDAILAADLFIYIGDLAELFAAAAANLRGGGLFAFSIETQQRRYVLRRTRRYGHSLDYIRELAHSHDFELLEARSASLRLGDEGPVEGHVIVLKRAV
jgi:predicted TPR repeat methyltransferase